MPPIELPTPGEDAGQWGTMLNNFLLVTHNGDGTLKDNIVSTAAIAAYSVTDSKISATGLTNVAISTTAAISADKLADGTTNKILTATERTKLAGIATGATANATDANLRDRTTHTGAQAISTVTNLQTTLDAKVPKSDYTGKGIILAGTATASTPQALAASVTNGHVLTADSTTTTGIKWAAASSSGLADPTTTKGDLIVRNATVPARLGVGSNGQVLTADSTDATFGVKWAAGLNSSYFNVRDYGATGDGSTNDLTAINSAVTAALAVGGIVWFPPGTYSVNGPIELPENVTLEGTHSDTLTYSGTAASPCIIKAAQAFSGSAVIRLRGKAETGRANDHVGARIINLTITGAAITNTASTIRGIEVLGNVREARFEMVTVYKTPGHGFVFGMGTSLFPASCRLISCVADNVGSVNTAAKSATGFHFDNVADTTVFDCNAQGCSNSGFALAGFMNGQVTNCRAEWSGHQGFYITSGYWGTGQGSGGLNMTGCTSDRNDKEGILINALGGATIQLTNLRLRRDGRNAGTGGGGYAALAVSAATMPVVVTNVQVYPGIDDGGTGTNSPQIGVMSTGSTSVVINSGYVHAATTAVTDGGANGTFIIDSTVGRATGTGAAPTRVAAVANAPVVSPAITGSATFSATSTTAAATFTGSTVTGGNSAAATFTGAVIATPVTVTGASPITIDARLGNHFRYTLAAATTLNAPTGMVDGQRILIELIQNGTGGYALTLNAAFNVTTSITGAITLVTTANTRSYIGAVYRSTGAKWDILAFGTGIAA